MVVSPVQIVIFSSDPDHMLVEGNTTKNAFFFILNVHFFLFVQVIDNGLTWKTSGCVNSGTSLNDLHRKTYRLDYKSNKKCGIN